MGMDLRRADTWSVEGKGGKSQFLCRVGGVLGLFLLEDHPAYECVPFQLSLWDTEMQLTMLVAGGSPALSLPPQVPPCPSSPSSQASPKKQSFSIVRGLGPLSRTSTWAERSLFTALVSQSGEFWESTRK